MNFYNTNLIRKIFNDLSDNPTWNSRREIVLSYRVLTILRNKMKTNRDVSRGNSTRSLTFPFLSFRV